MDCEDTSPERREKFSDDYYAKKTQGIKSVMPASHLPRPPAEEGSYRAPLEEKLEALALCDSGSDQCAFPIALAQQVSKIDP